jgi:hypothetical protein
MLCSRLVTAVDLSRQGLPGLAKQAEVTIDATMTAAKWLSLISRKDRTLFCNKFSAYVALWLKFSRSR